VELMYRRDWPTARLPGTEVSLLCFWLEDGETAGVVEVWRVEQIHSYGGKTRSCDSVSCSQRIWVQGRQISGCVPGRCSSSAFSSIMAGFFCGSFRSMMRLGIRLAMSSWRWGLVSADDFRRWRIPACEGPEDQNVISRFLRGLCVFCLVVQQFSVSFQNVPVFVLVFVVYPSV
jgi:hypothetical protein